MQDRNTLILAGICGVAASIALASALVQASQTPSEGNEAASGASTNSGGDGNVAGADQAPITWDQAMCTSWPDADDPQRPAGKTYGRDELADQLIGPGGRDYAVQFAEQCDALAAKIGQSPVADQIRYQVARYLDVLDRREAFRATLTAISKSYPAAAYLLAKEIDEKRSPEPETPDFDSVLVHATFATKGGDKRAPELLLKYALKQYPVYGYEFPTLNLHIFLRKYDDIPDTVETRVLLYSLWEAYKKRCNAWEVISLPPSYQASIDNFMIPVQLSRLKGIVEDIPNVIDTINQRISSNKPWSLIEILQDVNTVKAYPSQKMWTISVEATRDGSKLYDQFKCSGPRTRIMVNNLLEIIIQRERKTPAKGDMTEVERLTDQPDILTEIT